MSTFNGFTIVTLPTKPAPSAVDFTASDIVAASISPFTGQFQVQNWQSAWLEATVSMPPMKDAQARGFVAFLLACNGMANVFQLGDPMRKAPLGSGAGSPAVNGANQTGFTLQTKGWTASAAGVLLPGDLLQIGFRLYTNLGVLNADGSGDAIASIWPNIRESPADGAGITLNNTLGIWRLKTNERKWSIKSARTYGIQFEIREAI